MFYITESKGHLPYGDAYHAVATKRDFDPKVHNMKDLRFNMVKERDGFDSLEKDNSIVALLVGVRIKEGFKLEGLVDEAIKDKRVSLAEKPKDLPTGETMWTCRNWVLRVIKLLVEKGIIELLVDLSKSAAKTYPMLSCQIQHIIGSC